MAAYKPYFEKLKDPRWQKRRLEILELADWTCETCGDHTQTLNVHHGCYLKGVDPWDCPIEFMHVVCEDCHETETDKMQEIQRLIGRIRPGAYPFLYRKLYEVVSNWLDGEVTGTLAEFDMLGCEIYKTPSGEVRVRGPKKQMALAACMRLSLRRLRQFVSERIYSPIPENCGSERQSGVPAASPLCRDGSLEGSGEVSQASNPPGSNFNPGNVLG